MVPGPGRNRDVYYTSNPVIAHARAVPTQF